MTQNNNELGQRVKALRLAKGLSGAELGRLAGISRQRIQQFEEGKGGRTANPHLPTLKELAKALGVTLDDLVSEISKEHSELAEEMYAVLGHSKDGDFSGFPPDARDRAARWAFESAQITINKLPKDVAIHVLELWLKKGNGDG